VVCQVNIHINLAISSVGTVQNYQNTFIEQGSSWIFNFQTSNAYQSNSSLRFIFPKGFMSNKIQCNVSGMFNSIVQTRVLPNGNIYDCLNINTTISSGTSLNVIVSGVVNPRWSLLASGFKVQVLQANGIVIL
jgi:hypothetical protein